MVSPRAKAADIREIHVLSDQEAFAALSGLPKVLIAPANKAFLMHRINVVAQSGQPGS